MEIKEIQAHLVKHHLDGWPPADFHGRNNIAVDLLGLTGIVTRRSFYYIPHEGIPTALVHSIERAKFGSVPGVCITYSGYEELEREPAHLLKNAVRVAMEYSPTGRLPYVGLVDAGSVELVRRFGVEVVSSAEHGAGPNIDNLETEPRQELQEGHLFSIEPGIYSADYGFRTEIDVLMGHEGPEITTLPLQTEIKALF
jgi:hypothetical protein